METTTRDALHRELVLFLECIHVFADLDMEHLNYLAGLSGKVLLKPGGLLFSEGEPGDAVYVIKSGKVEVFSRLPNGDELVLARLGVKELIGEHYLLDGASGRRSASVRAADRTELIRISHASFSRLLGRHPQIAKQLAWRRTQREQENLARRSELYQLIREAPVQTPMLRRIYQASEVVFHEGDAADEVFIVAAGVAEAYRQQTPDVVLAELHPGQCFGERAVINDSPRTASVRARTELDVRVISREHFVRLHEQSPDLRDVVCGLEFSYRLPTDGVALQYTTRREGEDSIERLYRLPDRREFISSYLVHRHVFSMERLGVAVGPHIREFSWVDPGSQNKRSVRVAPLGDLHSITAAGDWPQLPRLIELTLEASPVTDAQVEAFVRTGEFPLADPSGGTAGVDEMACYCLNIPVSRITALINTGYSSFAALRKTTGCGTSCGGCEMKICGLLNPPDWIPVSAEATPVTEEARLFRLIPPPGRRYPQWQPGQHLTLEGRIRGEWVRRSYLIISDSASGEPVEILVQRAKQGSFTSWLMNGPPSEKQLRISAPMGDAVWHPGDRPTVVVVHEIGIALALAYVRHAVARGLTSRLHIECLAEGKDQLPGLPEFKNAGIEHPGITFNVRLGKFGKREIKHVAGSLHDAFADADFVLCAYGPDWVDNFGQALEFAGVAPDHIQQRFFARIDPLAQKDARRRWSLIGVGYVLAGLIILLAYLRQVGIL